MPEAHTFHVDTHTQLHIHPTISVLCTQSYQKKKRKKKQINKVSVLRERCRIYLNTFLHFTHCYALCLAHTLTHSLTHSQPIDRALVWIERQRGCVWLWTEKYVNGRTILWMQLTDTQFIRRCCCCFVYFFNTLTLVLFCRSKWFVCYFFLVCFFSHSLSLAFILYMVVAFFSIRCHFFLPLAQHASAQA